MKPKVRKMIPEGYRRREGRHLDRKKAASRRACRGNSRREGFAYPGM